MYYNNKVNITQNDENQVSLSYIRLFHASPNAPAVDIYAEGELLANDLSYGEITDYMTVPPGRYTLEVYPAGETLNPVLEVDALIPENVVITIAAVGLLDELALTSIPEPVEVDTQGRACIRFIHLSPDAPAVDILLEDGTKLFTDIGFKEATDYACVPGGTYTFSVNLAGTDTAALTVPEVEVSTNQFYTIYAIGLADGSPELEAILVPES